MPAESPPRGAVMGLMDPIKDWFAKAKDTAGDAAAKAEGRGR
jgi:hypothetical protein